MFNVAQFHHHRKSSLGSEFYYFDSLESTNKTAEQFAREGCIEGTVVLANQQTAGKGRKGNPWHSPADVNLYCSLVLRPPLSHLHYLPFISALAVARTLIDQGMQPDIKWPNDILVSARKVCGILIETAVEQSKVSSAIVGFGINVNGMEFPAELKSTAASVAQMKGSPVSRELLLALLLQHFEKLGDSGWDDLIAEVEKHSSYIKNCRVTITAPDGTVTEGMTAGLDSFGGLILEAGSERKTIYAGEVQECRRK
jgi:BirA family biotin operon repressor/biotin-[acetyl-CoA-carboxylase] ligase